MQMQSYCKSLKGEGHGWGAAVKSDEFASVAMEKKKSYATQMDATSKHEREMRKQSEH